MRRWRRPGGAASGPHDRPFTEVHARVANLAASVRFYQAALGPLGFVLCAKDDASAGFGPKGEPALWIYASDEPGPAHVAFRAAERKAVDRFHAAGLDAGGKDHGKPGVRADYAPNYYAAFLNDPDGNNVEAVCLK